MFNYFLFLTPKSANRYRLPRQSCLLLQIFLPRQPATRAVILIFYITVGSTLALVFFGLKTHALLVQLFNLPSQLLLDPLHDTVLLVLPPLDVDENLLEALVQRAFTAADVIAPRAKERLHLKEKEKGEVTQEAAKRKAGKQLHWTIQKNMWVSKSVPISPKTCSACIFWREEKWSGCNVSRSVQELKKLRPKAKGSPIDSRIPWRNATWWTR